MTKIVFNTEKHYRIKGNLENGRVNGKAYICKEEIVRRIKYEKNNKLYLECGRIFLIDNDLELEELNY
jgi:hypothetical protein